MPRRIAPSTTFRIHPRRAYQCPTHANGHNMILRAKPMLRPNNWRTRVRKLTIESSMSRYIRSLKAAFAAQISIIADFGLVASHQLLRCSRSDDG